MKWIYTSIKLNEVKIFLYLNSFLPEFSDSPNAKMCDPIIKTLLKMQPHYSQSQSIQRWKCDPIQWCILISVLIGSTPSPPLPSDMGGVHMKHKKDWKYHIGENPEIANNWCLNVWLNGDWENWSYTTCELITLSTLWDEIFRLRYIVSNLLQGLGYHFGSSSSTDVSFSLFNDNSIDCHWRCQHG